MVEIPKFKTKFDIFKFYDDLKSSGKKIAWVSAFAPAELILSFDIIPVYPENHAAMCGALSESREEDDPYSRELIARAMDEGHTYRNLCSYAVTDIGSFYLEEGSPIKGLPAPDLFYSCNSQCQVVGRWGDVYAKLFEEQGIHMPHLLLDAPKLVRKEEYDEDEITYFKSQMKGHIKVLEEISGKRYDEDRFRQVVRDSNEANLLWQECMDISKHIPSPWSSFDMFQQMAPIVIVRGWPECADYYRQLMDELNERIEKGIWGVPEEQIRLVWDAIPIWPRKNFLAKLFASHNACMVSSTYTHSWVFYFDERDPLDSLARRYAWNTMNRSKKWITDFTFGLVRDFSADGIVMHWNHSCGIWNSYVKMRFSEIESAGVPKLVIYADMVDASYFKEGEVTAQVGQFIESIKKRKALRPA